MMQVCCCRAAGVRDDVRVQLGNCRDYKPMDMIDELDMTNVCCCRAEEAAGMRDAVHFQLGKCRI